MQAGKVDVVAAILQYCSFPAGSSINELRTRTNLGAKQLNEYLNVMETKNLITISSPKKSNEIKITQRGKRFLDMYDALRMKYLTAITSE